MAETPSYIAKKSAWCAIRWWHVLLFFLIVPLICMICSIINEKSKRIEKIGFLEDFESLGFAS